MRGMVPPDPQTGVSRFRFAVVYLPGRKRRQSRNGRIAKRFPAACVEIKETRKEALEAAQGNENKVAAIVVGPSKSSEGQFIYYLGEWL